MNLKVSVWLKEVQVVPELGVNREKALSNPWVTRNHRQKGGKKKMKTKLLIEMVGLAILVAALLTVGLAQAGYYGPSATRNGTGGGYVTSWNHIYYNDVTYQINVATSDVFTDYGISAGSASLQERREALNTVNCEAYIRSDFYPSGNPNYGMYAWTYTYPSYTQDPTFSGTNLWYI